MLISGKSFQCKSIICPKQVLRWSLYYSGSLDDYSELSIPTDPYRKCRVSKKNLLCQTTDVGLICYCHLRCPVLTDTTCRTIIEHNPGFISPLYQSDNNIIMKSGSHYRMRKMWRERYILLLGLKKQLKNTKYIMAL